MYGYNSEKLRDLWCGRFVQFRALFHRLKVKRTKLPTARENASDHAGIAFSFVSDWLKEWHEFCGPIRERSNTKPMQSQIAVDIQLKIARIEILFSQLETLTVSFMRSYLEPDSEDYLFELRSSEPFTLTVTFEHPCTSSMASSKCTNWNFSEKIWYIFTPIS